MMEGFRKWLKRKSCTPMQKLKIAVKERFGDARLYRALCWIERHIIVRNIWVDIWCFEWVHADGSKELEYVNNALFNQAEYDCLDMWLRGNAGSIPTGFKLVLCNYSPATTDAIGDISGEPVGNNYARQTISRDNTGWPTLALDGGHYMATSETVTFGPATGGVIGPVDHSVLITAGNRMVAFAALSTSRTLQIGESLNVYHTIKLAA